ncbi:hypothetical protein QEN19_002140 [Hanseniaspora menglaensis]
MNKKTLKLDESDEKKSNSNCQLSTEISNDYAILHSENAKLSCFERILCIYTLPINADKVNNFSPLSFVDKQNSTIGKNFTKFYQNYFETYKEPLSTNYSAFNKSLKVYKVPGKNVKEFTGISSTIDIMVMELKKNNENYTRGLIATIEEESVGDSSFSEWFLYHLLEVSKLDYFESNEKIYTNNYHEIVAEYFNNHLKNDVKNDLWDKEGQFSFKEKLKHFTERMLPIQAILPAFPCKSTNLQKVAGTEPDLGEAFALETLINFCKNIKKHCYPPGFKIWIVSDGHVFSDCIGADDEVVDVFTKKLHSLYLKIKSQKYDSISTDHKDYIGFFGLKDVFYSETSGTLFKPEWLESLVLEHYTGSQIDYDSEICRKIMMAACDTDKGRLSDQVKIPNHPRLLLYRGFTKFMEEDIAKLEFVSTLSRNKQKKLASKVAFEMIKRNDAYSNLVDLCFPHYMRLSIHAHQNCGPKYGIRVVDSKICKVIKSFNDLTYPNYDDFLHIPTPWHNAVIKNTETGKYYFGKSKIVAQAIKSKCFLAELKNDANGMIYYELRSRENEATCEFDKCENDDEILSALKKAHCQTKSNANSYKDAVMKFFDKTTIGRTGIFTSSGYDDQTTSKILDKSETAIFDENLDEKSLSASYNLTPSVTVMDDGEMEEKLEKDLRSIRFESIGDGKQEC